MKKADKSLVKSSPTGDRNIYEKESIKERKRVRASNKLTKQRYKMKNGSRIYKIIKIERKTRD